MELGALHRTDASLPQMVCDVGTGQERTDVCRQRGHKQNKEITI